MTRTHEPFVSGLPGDLRSPVDPALVQAMELLGRAHEQVTAESDGLAPSTRERFDGCERIPAEPDAIAQWLVCQAQLAVLDLASTDGRLRDRVVAEIARRVMR